MKDIDRNGRLCRALLRSVRGRVNEYLPDNKVLEQMNELLAQENCRVGLFDGHIRIEFDSEEDEICFILKWS